MSTNQINKSQTDTNETSSYSPYNFADFQMSAAGAVISVLLQLNGIELKLGQLDNKMAAEENEQGLKQAKSASHWEQDQGKQQEEAQTMTGMGEISGGTLSICLNLGGEVAANRKMGDLDPGRQYLKTPGETEVKVSSAGEESNLENLDIQQNPAIQKRMNQLRNESGIDLKQTPEQFKTRYGEGPTEEISDAQILSLMKGKGDFVEKVQDNVKNQIEQQTKKYQHFKEVTTVVAQGLQTVTQGSFQTASAHTQAVSKLDEARATVAQSLITSLNSNQSNMQGQATNEFGMISAAAQYIEQLLMANKYNG